MERNKGDTKGEGSVGGKERKKLFKRKKERKKYNQNTKERGFV